jgi:hypothetical protein
MKECTCIYTSSSELTQLIGVVEKVVLFQSGIGGMDYNGAIDWFC